MNSCVIDEFQHVVKSCKQYAKLPFEFDTEFATAYFGKDKSGSLSYTDFTHFMRVRNSVCLFIDMSLLNSEFDFYGIHLQNFDLKL